VDCVAGRLFQCFWWEAMSARVPATNESGTEAETVCQEKSAGWVIFCCSFIRMEHSPPWLQSRETVPVKRSSCTKSRTRSSSDGGKTRSRVIFFVSDR
jgi:hypothetical protein